MLFALSLLTFVAFTIAALYGLFQPYEKGTYRLLLLGLFISFWMMFGTCWGEVTRQTGPILPCTMC